MIAYSSGRLSTSRRGKRGSPTSTATLAGSWPQYVLLTLALATGFVGSMLWNIKNAARAVRHNGPSVGRTVAAAAASAMCGAMVCGLADFLWNYPRVLVIFWFTFAMAIAGVKVCTEEAK